MSRRGFNQGSGQAGKSGKTKVNIRHKKVFLAALKQADGFCFEIGKSGFRSENALQEIFPI
jgi:hypothetical protein